MSPIPFTLDGDLVNAIGWCRIGGAHFLRPASSAAHLRAKALGLLARDNTWRATERGEGVLIALGLLDGAPAPERALVEMLWGCCERYEKPQFVCSWSESLSDAYPEDAKRVREKAEAWFRDFGDDCGWTFWTTFEHIDRPAVPEIGGS